MNSLVFVLLLTLTFQSGTKDDEDDPLQTYRRVEVWAPSQSKDFAGCETSKPIEIARITTLWAIMKSRTEPKTDITKVEGICIGVNPKDVLPKNEGAGAE